MNYSEFIKKYNGKGIDYDGVAGVQCVDLAKQYLHDVFGINAGSWGNAHAYYDNFNSISALKNNFNRIAYTSNFVPQQGDIVVWSKTLNGNYGHIAIATGEGDKTYFYSYDQNWTGKHDVCTKIKHTYKCVAGVLRAKSASTASSSTVGFKIGSYTLTENVKVRTGAGTNYSQKLRSQLTANGQAHALSQTYAVLKSGTAVTVSEIKAVGNDVWGKIPSGWIAIYYGGKRFVK
jgi:hypothetical protein